jgi:hypothetical protein
MNRRSGLFQQVECVSAEGRGVFIGQGAAVCAVGWRICVYYGIVDCVVGVGC